MQHGIGKKYCRNILLCSVGCMIAPVCLHRVDRCGIGIKYWTGMFKSGGLGYIVVWNRHQILVCKFGWVYARPGMF